MKTFRPIIFTLLVSILTIPTLKAVKAYPFPTKITQPDGTTITIQLHGDEFFHYKSTLDGYALIPNEKGIMTYAQQDANGKLITTNVEATDINRRSITEKNFIQNLKKNIDFSSQAQSVRSGRSLAPAVSTISTSIQSYPLTGTPKSIAILVNFSDKSFVTSTPQTAFTNLLNQDGYSANGGTGSANNYFKDNSKGVFSPEFDVVGPYTLPHNMAYYGANDATTKNDVNPQQMVVDGCTLAAAAGVDFSKYDVDGDGIVDNVFIYYAGYNEAESGPANSVWPHRWAIYPTSMYSNGNYTGTVASTTFNGKRVEGYACTSELRGSTGSNMCGIGTFCHEFGHVLGLDDMYNTVDQTKVTLSYWDIMDAGPYLNNGRTPPAYSAYERFYLKWLVPTELKSANNCTLSNLATGNNAFLISQYGNHNLNGSNPSPVEFFLLENRQNTGWDTYLYGHGMLITHIYYNASTWADNTPNNDPTAMGVDIVEADGTAIETAASLAGATSPETVRPPSVLWGSTGYRP